MRSFCRKKNHVHKIPRFRGRGYFGFGGGVPILFLWARRFFRIRECIMSASPVAKGFEERAVPRVSGMYSTGLFGCSATLGITTVQIEILGAKFQILGPRCAPHYFSGPSQNLLGAKKPIRVAPIRVVTKYIGCSITLGITTVGRRKISILSPRCAPHYFSGPSQNLLGAKNQFA